MMALDQENNLKRIPTNIGKFLRECMDRNVREICMTGTNTDPLLYKKTFELLDYIRYIIPNVPLAIRTNAVLYDRNTFGYYDKASITICSFNPEIYVKMMGSGKPPDLPLILANHSKMDIKINIVMGPENVNGLDIFNTLDKLAEMGVKRVNLREPYGQPHIGDPMPATQYVKQVLGMPSYNYRGMSVTYWDVHYVEVESVNLYANGSVSITYPITKGYDPSGLVLDQSHFPGGRIHEQWL